MRHLVMTSDGNDFHKMIRSWEDVQKIMKEEDSKFVRAKMLVDGQDFVFFFSCRDNIYGANENSRSVFSVMKNPMDEPGYEAMSFSATNLTNAMKGDPKEEIFIFKDISHIKVLEKEVARHLIMKNKVKAKDTNVDEKMRDIKQGKSDKSRDGRMKLNKDFEAL